MCQVGKLPCQLVTSRLVPSDLCLEIAPLVERVRQSLEGQKDRIAEPITFSDGSYLADAALAGQIVLADVEACLEWVDMHQQPLAPYRWPQLIAQLDTLRQKLDEG